MASKKKTHFSVIGESVCWKCHTFFTQRLRSSISTSAVFLPHQFEPNVHVTCDVRMQTRHLEFSENSIFLCRIKAPFAAQSVTKHTNYMNKMS